MFPDGALSQSTQASPLTRMAGHSLAGAASADARQAPSPTLDRPYTNTTGPAQDLRTPATGLSSSTDVPAQADVDDFLRRKRKVREHKACYPCRQRKVKCDLGRPCQTCVQRDHPEVCSYHPPSKRQSIGAPGLLTTLVIDDDATSTIIKAEDTSPASSGAAVTLSRNEFDMLLRKLNSLEDNIASLRTELDGNRSSSRHDFHSHTHTSPHSHARYERPDARDSDEESDCRRRPPSELSSGQTPVAKRELHGLPKRTKTASSADDANPSVPSIIYAIGQGEAVGDSEQAQQLLNEFLGKSVLPLVGLDNETATYPFVDLWGLPHASLQRAHGLAKALPSDDMMLSLFKYYHDVSHLVFPGLADIRQLESDLTMFLIARATSTSSGASDGITEMTIYGRSFSWLAILFAVLANGAQFSDKPRKDCELTASVYVCCAFECLRHCNFLAAPRLESVQALLIIGIVMTNNMNAAAGWTLLGLTSRIAQGLGLHEPCSPRVSQEVALRRSTVWWGIIWQDSILSITYDRIAGQLDLDSLPMPQHFGHVSCYHASMYRICKVSLRIVRERAAKSSSAHSHAHHHCHVSHGPHEQIARITQYANEISLIIRESPEYLRDSRKCSTPRESIEHFGLYLHTSYVMSELYRPAITPAHSDPQIVATFRTLCIENLANTIEAYLGLTQVDLQRLSWAAIHRALGCALLLCILKEHWRNDRARSLIQSFIASMQANAGNPFEISAPTLRGLDALGRLFDTPAGPPATTDATTAPTHALRDVTAPPSSSYTPANPPDSRAGSRFYDPLRPPASPSFYSTAAPSFPPISSATAFASPSSLDVHPQPSSSSPLTPTRNLKPHAYPRLYPLNTLPQNPPLASASSANAYYQHPTEQRPNLIPPSTAMATSFATPSAPGTPSSSSYTAPTNPTSTAAIPNLPTPGPGTASTSGSDSGFTSPHAMLHTILWGEKANAMKHTGGVEGT